MKTTTSNFIRRLQSGKEDALEYVIDQYLPIVKGITYKILSPLKKDSMIEECINDIFLSAWRHAKDFQGESADFPKWLCAIAKFKAIDYYRKAANSREISTDYLEQATSSSPEEDYVRGESHSELLLLIHKLEPIDQQIFILRFFLEEDTEAIAQKLGKTKASIDNRIYRARKKLNNQFHLYNMGGNLI